MRRSANNGKLERLNKTVKSEGIRTSNPGTLEEARRVVGKFVEHYNNVRLHSAIEYLTPADKAAGRGPEILEARDEKLHAARELRRLRRNPASSSAAIAADAA